MKYANAFKLLVETIRFIFVHRDLFIWMYMLLKRLKNSDNEDTYSLIDSLAHDEQFLALTYSINRELKSEIDHEILLSSKSSGEATT